jgi:hypothetical protein
MGGVMTTGVYLWSLGITVVALDAILLFFLGILFLILNRGRYDRRI